MWLAHGKELKDAKDAAGNIVEEFDDLEQRVETLEADVQDMQTDAAMDKAFLLSH